VGSWQANLTLLGRGIDGCFTGIKGKGHGLNSSSGRVGGSEGC